MLGLCFVFLGHFLARSNHQKFVSPTNVFTYRHRKFPEPALGKNGATILLFECFLRNVANFAQYTFAHRSFETRKNMGPT